VKADKLQELAELMHTSVGRVEAIRERQAQELASYEEQETEALDEKRKKLHYEHIRVTEERASLTEDKSKVDTELAKIDDLVYADTKEQHLEKQTLDENIGELDREIEELSRVLERKRKQKEILELEKQVHERKIQAARMKYADVLEGLEARALRVNSKLQATDDDEATWQTDTKQLEELQAAFDAKAIVLKDELKKLREMQQYLKSSSGDIDEIHRERKEIRIQMAEVENKLATLEQDRKQMAQGREFLMERVVRLESELDDFEQEIQSNAKKHAKSEAEKKKFAAAKKFKDAGKCQQEMKEVSTR